MTDLETALVELVETAGGNAQAEAVDAVNDAVGALVAKERARTRAWIAHDAAVVAYLRTIEPFDGGGSSELCTCEAEPGWPHKDWCGAWLASADLAEFDAPDPETPNARVAREDHDESVHLYGPDRVAELEREANK